ncbi:MAG: helix-turn-helix domain-containing protein [Eubacteriales bacterium]
MSNSYKNSYTVPNKELVSLSVYNTGYQKCTPNHQWGPGIRDRYLLHHVVSGKGFYKIGEITYELFAGDTFLIYPWEEVTYYADESDPWEYAWVGFSGTDALTILKASGFSHNNPIIYQGHLSDYIRRQLIHIYEARGNELYNAVEMTGRLYTTLSGFLQHNESANKSHQTSYDAYAKKGLEYIHSNYIYPITVVDIAKHIGISRSHLFRAFQEILNTSPKEYLTSFRINQACILLKHSDLSITAIGRSVGFEDNLNFSKAFKKATGVAPSQYRI